MFYLNVSYIKRTITKFVQVNTTIHIIYNIKIKNYMFEDLFCCFICSWFFKILSYELIYLFKK